MPKPRAYFTFQANDLSVQFADRSAGIITSYLWDFGFKDNTNTPVTSTLSNPEVTFPDHGTYRVKLKVSNSSGMDIAVLELQLSIGLTMQVSIWEMVEYQLSGASVEPNMFTYLLRKWQLFLQNSLTPEISNEDVFVETKWPALANQLISKLIVYDLIVKASVSFPASLNLSGNKTSFANTSVIQVYDYSIPFDKDSIFADNHTVVINKITMNGVDIAASGTLTSAADMLNYLNALGKGVFIFNGVNLLSQTNANIITTFQYTRSGGTLQTLEVTQSNPHIVDTQTGVQESDSNGIQKGGVKKLETGPTKAEWHDGSIQWMNMFKGAANSKTGEVDNLMNFIKEDICLYARRLGIRLLMCKLPKKTYPFQVKRF